MAKKLEKLSNVCRFSADKTTSQQLKKKISDAIAAG